MRERLWCIFGILICHKYTAVFTKSETGSIYGSSIAFGFVVVEEG